MAAQRGVVCVVGCQGDVKTARQQKGACHGQKVQHTCGRGAAKIKIVTSQGALQVALQIKLFVHS